MIALLLLAACPPANRAWRGPSDTGLAGPTVSWSWPEEDAVLATGTDLTLQVVVAEPDGALSDLEISLTLDNQLATPTVAADGTVSLPLVVQAGEQVASISVTDPDGLTAQADRHWTGNSSPTVAITQPLDGSTNTTGKSWSLVVETTDTDGGIDGSYLSVTFDGAEVSRTSPWEPSQGPLELPMSPLSSGAHTIGAETSDGVSMAAAWITVYGN
ncbi:MAG: hypothetical protein GXP62_15345 [Oligoflexia bacterium]|nr:hypothetical protein [Oligoflexia bacterium]